MTNMLIIERKPKVEFKVKQVSIKSYWLTTGEMRLAASFYAPDVFQARKLLKESGYDIMRLDDLSEDVFYLARQKRFFAESNIGDPYLMPSELFYFPFSPSKFVYAGKLKKAEDWYVKEGWLLLTRSGKLGMPFLTTKLLQTYIISDDVIRIIPKSDIHSGFLYAYLSTWLGNVLLTKDQYGIAVDHIEPHHVKSLSIPLLPEEIRKQIHENITKVFNLRDQARRLLKKSEEMLLEELEIPEPGEIAKTSTFNVNSSDLRLRLDASYHDPTVRDLQDRLRKGKHKAESIDENTGKIFIPGRFKRIYVQKEYGVPFLSGTQIAQIKPYDLKYISRKATRNLEDWIINPGWVLVTCSGTIGRVTLAPKEWDGWAVSQHVLRIIPNLEKVHPGFLTIFLMSKLGYPQVISKIYGGVVDELAEDDMKDILVPLPPMDVQEKIGKLVIEAYELKELANKIEDDTIHTLEDMLTKHRKIEVNLEYLKEMSSYAETFDLIGDEEFRESLDEANKGETISFEEFKKEHGL